MRIVLVLLALVAGLVLVACGGDDDDAPDVTQPTVPSGWFTFDAPAGCLSFSYPSDWQLKTKGDVDAAGDLDCPGGSNIENVVSDCTPETTGTVLAIARAQLVDTSQPSGLAAWVELHGAVKRCETFDEHFEMLIIASGGQIVESGEGQISGTRSRCAFGKRSFSEQTFDVQVCLAEIDGKLYLLTTSWDTARATELKPIAEAIAGSFDIAPVD